MALEVMAVTRLPLEQARQQRNTHVGMPRKSAICSTA